VRPLLRSALLAFALLAVAGAAYLIFRPVPILVEVAPVTRGRFVATVEDDGRTRVRDRYIISAPVAGRLLRLEARAGDIVSADEVVATILPSLPALLDPRTRREAEERLGAAEALVAETLSQVERLKSVREEAETNAARARTLRQSGVMAAQQFERAELAALVAAREESAAEMRRHAAEHAVDQARAVLRRFDSPDSAEKLEVKSPVSGRVLRVIRESETPVSGGESLLEIGDPASLEIVVDVLTTDAVAIRPGAPVTIEHWGGPESLDGRVRLVEPGAFTKVSALGVEEQRVWVVIDLVSPHDRWATLGDGFRVDAAIVTEEIDDALLVPQSALFHRDGGWAVFLVRDGVAHKQPVEIAHRSTRVAAVAGGLSPGDQVVLFPPSALTDGATVKPEAALWSPNAEREAQNSR
jgi:HlyD family secretion protein